MKHEVPAMSALSRPSSARGGAILRNLGFAAVCAATVTLGSLPAAAQVLVGHESGPSRNLDARLAEKNAAQKAPAAAQISGLEALRRDMPDLSVIFDENTGVTRSIYNASGFLTLPQSGDPQDLAMEWVQANLGLLGLSAADLGDPEVTDSVYSSLSGATHLYLRQVHQELPVYNGQLHVNVADDGQILSVNNAFVPGLGSSLLDTTPVIGADLAVASALDHLGLKAEIPTLLGKAEGIQQKTSVDPRGISFEPIEAQLMWLPMLDGTVRLVWNFQIATLDSQHWYDMNIDAQTGKVWTRFDWTNAGTYRVYPRPVESPIHTTPLPPSDARSLAVNPENALASPSGWFGGGTMAGNNVHACVDASPNNACDTPEPSCSGTTCDFAINLSGAPSTYQPAAVTNLFYWNNLIHDIQYQYGFDEAGGNFQENNFGRGGAGSDSVNADAQDGSGTCNANFSTPTDGGNPRMQMFICNNGTPNRDGDIDNGVIVHEYGHGISIRQVGGPNNSSCLNNTQQPGEGWSDWHGLVYTAKASDTGPQPRGLGAYLFFLAPDGTIRPQRYSTDPAINNYTYASIAGQSVPHGVGSVWAQAIWEVYWALVDKYGFDSNLYNATGGAGNQRALQYVNEGFKNTACSPTFLQTRDGIIQAATTLNGGVDRCLIWQAFANFGLGTDATTGGSNSTSATNGFSIPADCQAPCTPPAAPTGLTATVPTGINNRVDLSWNASAGATSYKVFRSTTSGGPYTEIATVATTSFSDTGVVGGTTYFYVVQAGNSATCFSGNSNQASATPNGGGCSVSTLYTHNFETGSGLSNWTRGSFGGNGSVTSWRGIQTCTAASGTHIFRYGGSGCTGNYSNNNFNFAQPNGSGGIFVPAGSIGATLSFKHRRQYESGFDGGTLTVSLNGTNYFLVPAAAITGASYNGTVTAGCAPAGSAGISTFTGTQSTFVTTTVDLDAMCNSITGGSGGCGGQSVRIGFTSITDCSVTADGWFLDDVTVTACTP